MNCLHLIAGCALVPAVSFNIAYYYIYIYIFIIESYTMYRYAYRLHT